MNGIGAILGKEVRDAVHGRWLIAFAVTFGLVALMLAAVQQGGSGMQGFNRTTASLVNLCLLLVPLLALILGAGAIAGERDRGTLATLLAQPISTTDLVIGKYAGLSIALWATVALGFGVAGLLMALVGPVTDIAQYGVFILLSGLLASAMLSIGMLISAVSDGRVKALALAVLVWFGLVLLYQLGAVGLALALSTSGRALVLASVLNPVEAVRILAVLSLEPDLQVLGPMGAYLHLELGTARSVALLAGATLTWAALPIAAAAFILRRLDT
jgi:Cu-processing system permease protein